MVDPKPRTVAAVAGVNGSGLEKCFPPTPRATRNEMRTGIHAIRSYLCIQANVTTLSRTQTRYKYYHKRTFIPQNDTYLW